MTVSAAPALAGPFDGNDVATSFPFDFKIFADSDLRVVLRDALAAEYLLTLDVDYSVSMIPDQNADPGGTITYPLSGSPLATGERLTVTTDLELSQQTVFTNLGKFFPATVEDTFDRLTMLLRQIQAESVRAIRVPVSLSDVLTDLPTPVAGAALVWNEDGTALVNGVPTESLIAISSFMANVIQAVDAAEARTDIGAAADAEVVKLTGDQTIAGVKTFSSAPVIPDAAAAQNPVSKAQLDAEAAARTAAIAAAVLPSTLAPTLFVHLDTVNSTSGTEIDFLDVPAHASELVVLFDRVSTNGTAQIIVQIGDAGGIETADYFGSAIYSGGAGNFPASGVGVIGANNTAAAIYVGRMHLRKFDPSANKWIADGNLGRTDSANGHIFAGVKELTAALDRVRVTTVGGANTFDGGQISVWYR